MASLISDKDIENLERIKQVLSEVKQILKEIREIDNSFSLSNVIEVDEDTVLVFNCDTMIFKQEDLNRYENILSTKFNHKCILLNGRLTLDKAIGTDYAKGRDYTTVTYYNDEGNLIKEETTQYK
jgi:hypothetical protein